MDEAALKFFLIAVTVTCLFVLLLSLVVGDFLDFLSFDIGGEGSTINSTTFLVFIIVFSVSTYVSLNNGLAWYWSFGIGALIGAPFGLAISYMINSVMKSSGSSTWTIDMAVGQRGTVTVAIEPGRVGQVAVLLRKQRALFNARSDNNRFIPANSGVRIIEAQGGDTLIVETIS